jgi:hypothetical protein
LRPHDLNKQQLIAPAVRANHGWRYVAGRLGCRRCGSRAEFAQQQPCLCQLALALAVAEETEVTDFDETFW